jgi:hypothetical protein
MGAFAEEVSSGWSDQGQGKAVAADPGDVDPGVVADDRQAIIQNGMQISIG